MKKRKDGRYCKQVQIGYTAEGKPKYKNFYGYNQREVERDALLFRNDLEKGIAIIDDALTLEDWAKRWLELYKTNVEYNTIEMYKNTVNNHILSTLGRFKLKDIKKHHVQELINKLVGEGKERTADIVKLTLTQILEQAIENEYVYKNVNVVCLKHYFLELY